MEVIHNDIIKYVVCKDGKLRAVNTQKQAITRPFKGVEYHDKIGENTHLITFS